MDGTLAGVGILIITGKVMYWASTVGYFSLICLGVFSAYIAPSFDDQSKIAGAMCNENI